MRTFTKRQPNLSYGVMERTSEIYKLKARIAQLEKEIRELKGMPLKMDWHEITQEITKAVGVTEQDILGRRRTRLIVVCRQIVQHYLRTTTGAMLSDIGRAMGRDHSSVIHSCNLVDNWLSYPHIYKYENTILKQINYVEHFQKQGEGR